MNSESRGGHKQSSKRNGEQVLFMFIHAAFILCGVVTVFLGPILPDLAFRWHLSDAQAGYFFTAQFLGSSAGVVSTTVLLPRRGFRFSLVLAYILMAAGVWGLALEEWKFALLSAFFYGFGFGLAIPTSNLLISDAQTERRAAAISVLNFYWSAGAVAAPAVILVMERRNAIWSFINVLSLVLALTALVLLFTPEPSSTHPPNERVPATLQGNPYGRRLIAMIAAMFLLYVGTEAALGGWITALMKRLPGWPAGVWIPAASFFWGGLIIGRGLAPLALRHTRERTVALAGLAGAIPAIAVLMFVSRVQWIVLASAVAGLGLAPVYPITIAYLAQFGEMEHRIAGAMFALAGLGGALLPWMVGFFSTYANSLQVGFTVPLAASVLLLWLHSGTKLSSQGPGSLQDSTPHI